MKAQTKEGLNRAQGALSRDSLRSWREELLGISRYFVGRRFTEALGEMQTAQWLSPDELQARTDDRLAQLLRHAAENTPFYRDFYRRSGLGVDALRAVSDLAELPIVGKSDYRERGMDAFCAENIPPYRRLDRTTSGSTGEPFRFCLDRAALPLIFASHLFYDSWYSLRPFDRYLRIIAPPAPPSDFPPRTPVFFRLRQSVKTWLQQIYESRTQRKVWLWEVDEARAVEVWREIEDFKPGFVMGYTSTLAALANLWKQQGLRLSSPVRGVIAIAETLTEARRHAIDQYFKAPIINRYGLRELGYWSAQSCSHSPDKFHINTELVVCEILRDDGSPAAHGETGRVVLTDLWNYARPFIRYETGDLAVADSSVCGCGRGFPLLGEIEGRSTESLRTPSGKEISSVNLGHYLFVYGNHLDAVSQYQLVQKNVGQVCLLIVPTSEWTEQHRQRLLADLIRLLNGEMEVTVEVVTQISPERSGKRPIIKVEK